MKTILFDMDGTLTEPRKKVQRDVINFLSCLSKEAKIGIVTGSPLEYILDQLGPAFSSWDSETLSKFALYPCNGTQSFSFDAQSDSFILKTKISFFDYLSSLGDANTLYMHLIMNILNLQSHALKSYNTLKVSGHFISFRESVMNWSIPGRESSQEIRDDFSAQDKKFKIRESLRECLRIRLDSFGLESLETALGGSTSIDIYPKGWDKTYVLNHVPEEEAWFFGDKCSPGGNDFSLYRKLSVHKRAYQVKNPEDTLLKGMSLLDKLSVSL